MIQAQYLMGGNAALTPWMPREADNALVVAALLEKVTSDLSIKMYHKNRDETGDGSAVQISGSSPADVEISISTAGQQAAGLFEGVKELVRFRVAASGSEANYVLYRFMTIAWHDTIEAS